jgi:hypothetical protein
MFFAPVAGVAAGVLHTARALRQKTDKEHDDADEK